MLHELNFTKAIKRTNMHPTPGPRGTRGAEQGRNGVRTGRCCSRRWPSHVGPARGSAPRARAVFKMWGIKTLEGLLFPLTARLDNSASGEGESLEWTGTQRHLSDSRGALRPPPPPPHGEKCNEVTNLGEVRLRPRDALSRPVCFYGIRGKHRTHF